MKRFLFLIFLIIATALFSQRNYTNEISLVTDNDLYTSLYRDGYYTNGIFINYYTLKSSTNKKIEKKIIQFQLGQMMYTPFRATILYASMHDRPFAGYLFGQYGVNRFYKNESILQTTLQLGVIGPSSGAREAQAFIHHIYGFPTAVGWDYQIREALGLNLGINYSHLIKRTNSKLTDVSTYSSVNVGSIFTNFATGIYARFGFEELQKIFNTVGLHSNFSSDTSRQTESFFYVKPMINYVLYDATIQGSFLNKSSPVTFDVMPFVFQLETGLRFATGRFNYGYTVYYHTKKLKNDQIAKSNLYGRIFVGYCF